MHVLSRQGKLLTQFPNISTELLKLRGRSFILDGEIVALDDEGHQSFELLQSIRRNKRRVHFIVFDVLHYEGKDFLKATLKERRAFLNGTFTSLPERVKLSPVLEAEPSVIMEKLHEMEFEGIVAKRWESIYEPGKRSGAWQKHKTQRTDDFVVGGFIGEGAVEQLVVGELREGKLYFVEAVKNGFVPATRRKVYRSIHKLATDKQPFVNLPEKKRAHAMDREKMREVHWLKPTRIAEVAFNERTKAGHLRHSKFVRLRDDK